MDSIPDFLQESFQGGQDSGEEYTRYYGKIDDERMLYREQKIISIQDMCDQIINLRPNRWIISNHIANTTYPCRTYYFMDNYAEIYSFTINGSYNLTNEYLNECIINGINEIKKKGPNKFILSNNLIDKIKKEHNTIYNNEEFKLYMYMHISEIEFKNYILRKELESIKNLIAEKDQKSDTLEKPETPKTILQRFQEKLKAL